MTSVYNYENIITIKIMNRSITPKSFPSPPLQTTIHLLSITIYYFAFCRILRKWNQTAHTLSYLAVSTQYNYFEMGQCCWVYQEFTPFFAG